MLKRGRQKVQRLGGTARKNDFPRFLGVDEIRHGLAGVFVGFGSLLAEIMHPTVDVAVFVQVIVALALNDAQGFLRGGGVVQINQGLAVNLLV